MINHSKPFIVPLQCKNFAQKHPSDIFVFVIHRLHPLVGLRHCTCRCMPSIHTPSQSTISKMLTVAELPHARDFKHFTYHPWQGLHHQQPIQHPGSKFHFRIPQNTPNNSSLRSGSLQDDRATKMFTLWGEDNQGDLVTIVMSLKSTHKTTGYKERGWMKASRYHDFICVCVCMCLDAHAYMHIHAEFTLWPWSPWAPLGHDLPQQGK